MKLLECSRFRSLRQELVLCQKNVEFSLKLSDRVYILEKAEVRYEGRVEEFMKNEEVHRTYLTV
jgi:branched-chain amino acid transport system ATP-binding protein